MNKKTIPIEHVRESQKLAKEANVCLGFKKGTCSNDITILVYKSTPNPLFGS